MIELVNREFVPIAVEINHLVRQKDDEGRFFRLVSRQGRFGLSFDDALASVEDTTWQNHESHQGLYAATVNGHLLGSRNTRDADILLEVLRGALEKLSSDDLGADDPIPQHGDFVRDDRYRWMYPDDGLVLQMGCVDLPRRTAGEPEGRWKDARNHDYVWVTRDEMLQMIPDAPSVGDSYSLPDPITRRLARFHLLDCVRGENHSWPKDAIRELDLRFTVTTVSDDAVDLELSGRVHMQESGEWCLGAPRESASRGSGICCLLNEQGFTPEVLGAARVDLTQKRFTRFDLVAVGTRWGGTRYNGRRNDVEPAPLGIAMTIAGTAHRDRTPPHASLSAYFNA